MATREEDFVKTVFTASTHDNIIFFTTEGRAYVKKGYSVPEAGRQARGSNIVNLINIDNSEETSEKVSAMIKGRSADEDSYLFFVTRKGTVKRLAQTAISNIRKTGIRAITLDEGDELIAVISTSGNDEIFIVTHDGAGICIKETAARSFTIRSTWVKAGH